jgi:hypothetical protein
MGHQQNDDTSALARKITVRELVSAYEDACATVRAAFGMLVEAERRMNAIYAMGESIRSIRITADRGTYRDNFEDVDDCLERIRREAWGVIVDRLELQRMMSIERWNDLSRQLQNGDLPEITEESVFDFAQGYHDALPAMLTEAIVEVFEWLRPRGQHAEPKYKRNSELEVPARIVLTGMVERSFKGGWWLRGHREPRLTALENVFSALDGRGQINKRHKSALQDTIEKLKPGEEGRTPYFAVRCFKNGNVHLTFLRPELLARFNQIAGGARLRPAA